MADTYARISFLDGGSNSSTPLVVGAGVDQQASSDWLPCKEWSIADDVLNMSDTASVTIANVDGEYSGMFYPGMRARVELSNEDVADGAWTPQFFGVVIETQTGSDMSGGSVIALTMMDVGWYLTSCCAAPLTNLRRIASFQQLLTALIDPSWGIKSLVPSNDLNRRLKHGRQVVAFNFRPVEGAVLPRIQVEPGQTPFDLIGTYAQRAGLLVNASVNGSLVFFRPDYDQQALYEVVYYPTASQNASSNNVVGRPTLKQTIDGLYSQTQCWSTAVINPALLGPADAEDPNASFRHETYTPPTSPISFKRLCVFSDPEAIYKQLRVNRAIWKFQMGLFNSWEYGCEFDAHQQNGAFFTTDTLVTLNDVVNDVTGMGYVQIVRKSQTLKDGSRTSITVRKPGLLNPNLNSLDNTIGGGAAPSTKRLPKKRGSASPSALDALFDTASKVGK